MQIERHMIKQFEKDFGKRKKHALQHKANKSNVQQRKHPPNHHGRPHTFFCIVREIENNASYLATVHKSFQGDIQLSGPLTLTTCG